MAAADDGLRPEQIRDVIDAVGYGILTPAEARSYFGLDVAVSHTPLVTNQARDGRAVGASSSYLSRALWGLCWRFMIIAAVFLVAFGLAVAPPVLLVLGFVATGLLLGLWHRHRHGLGPLWRTVAMASTTAYVVPALPLFPYALIGLLGISVVTPLVAARRHST